MSATSPMPALALNAWRAHHLPAVSRALELRVSNPAASAALGHDYLGKALAGIISGAIHDVENRRGVEVSSAAHPEPWTAMGDSHLVDTSSTGKDTAGVSLQQSQAAVLAGKEDIDRALVIGQREG